MIKQCLIIEYKLLTSEILQVSNEHNQAGFVPSNYVRKESLLDKAKGTFKGMRKHSAGNVQKPKIPDFGLGALPSLPTDSWGNRPVNSTIVDRISPESKAVSFGYRR
jgi:hypothetical protein